MPESYSVNQLKSWTKCQKRYEYEYKRKLRWPSNPKNFRLGKGVHQLLDYASRDLDLTPIVGATDEDIVAFFNILKDSRWSHLVTIASEWGFSLAVEGHWLYGRIDRIVQDGDKVVILDWKTGTGIPLNPAEDWQTVIYLYAVFEAREDLGLDVQPEQLAFSYVQVKNGALSEVTVPYSEAMHTATGHRLRQTLAAIQSASAYHLPPKCPDAYCPYGHICGIDFQPKPRQPKTEVR